MTRKVAEFLGPRCDFLASLCTAVQCVTQTLDKDCFRATRERLYVVASYFAATVLDSGSEYSCSLSGYTDKYSFQLPIDGRDKFLSNLFFPCANHGCSLHLLIEYLNSDSEPKRLKQIVREVYIEHFDKEHNMHSTICAILLIRVSPQNLLKLFRICICDISLWDEKYELRLIWELAVLILSIPDQSFALVEILLVLYMSNYESKKRQRTEEIFRKDLFLHWACILYTKQDKKIFVCALHKYIKTRQFQHETLVSICKFLLDADEYDLYLVFIDLIKDADVDLCSLAMPITMSENCPAEIVFAVADLVFWRKLKSSPVSQCALWLRVIIGSCLECGYQREASTFIQLGLFASKTTDYPEDESEWLKSVN